MDGKRTNVMTAGWLTPIEIDPPLPVILINKEAYTRDLILKSGIFDICVPTTALINQVHSIGHLTGREGK